MPKNRKPPKTWYTAIKHEFTLGPYTNIKKTLSKIQKILGEILKDDRIDQTVQGLPLSSRHVHEVKYKLLSSIPKEYNKYNGELYCIPNIAIPSLRHFVNDFNPQVTRIGMSFTDQDEIVLFIGLYITHHFAAHKALTIIKELEPFVLAELFYLPPIQQNDKFKKIILNGKFATYEPQMQFISKSIACDNFIAITKKPIPKQPQLQNAAMQIMNLPPALSRNPSMVLPTFEPAYTNVFRESPSLMYQGFETSSLHSFEDPQNGNLNYSPDLLMYRHLSNDSEADRFFEIPFPSPRMPYRGLLVNQVVQQIPSSSSAPQYEVRTLPPQFMGTPNNPTNRLAELQEQHLQQQQLLQRNQELLLSRLNFRAPTQPMSDSAAAADASPRKKRMRSSSKAS